jgi:hypothetical protein
LYKKLTQEDMDALTGPVGPLAPGYYPGAPPYPIPLAPAPVPVVYEAPEPRRVDPYQHTTSQILQDRNATVAKVSISQLSSYDFGVDPDFSFIATGASKREHGDKFNARTGELLALSRAYLHLSRQLFAAGRALVEPEPEDDRNDRELNEWGAAEEVAAEEVAKTVLAFNAAADALNAATEFIRGL